MNAFLEVSAKVAIKYKKTNITNLRRLNYVKLIAAVVVLLGDKGHCAHLEAHLRNIFLKIFIFKEKIAH